MGSRVGLSRRTRLKLTTDTRDETHVASSSCVQGAPSWSGVPSGTEALQTRLKRDFRECARENVCFCVYPPL